MTALDLYCAARAYVEDQGETMETAEAFFGWLEGEHREEPEYIERRSMRELWDIYRRAFLEEDRMQTRIDACGERRRELVRVRVDA